jgi:tetratricopeptide (TPR) repeat protein
MKKGFFVILGLLVTGITTMTGQADLTQGIKLIANENYGEATKFFEKVMTAEPKNGKPLYYLGKIKYALEDFKGAEELYNKAVLLDKKCVECQIGQASMFLDNNKVLEADKILMGLDKSNKKNAAIIAMIGDAYLYSKNPSPAKAITFLAKSRDLDPKVGSTWSHLGDAYNANNQLGDAMSAYETASAKDKTNVESLLAQAKIWRKSKNYEDAEKRLNEAIKLAPEFAPAYKDLVEVLVAKRDYARVTPVLEQYVKLAGNDEAAKVRLVKFLAFQAKDYARAIQMGEELKKTSKDYTLNRWLLWSYVESEKYEDGYKAGKELFADIAKDAANRKEFTIDYEYLAKAAMKTGQTQEGLSYYERVFKEEPAKAEEVYGTLAKSAFDEKKYDQAIEFYTKKGAVKPLSVTELYYLGLSQYQTKKYVDSDLTFKKIIELTPTYALAYYYIAKCADKQDPDRLTYAALPAFQKFIEVANVDREKNKKNLIEAYNYVGYGLVKAEDNVGARAAFENVILLDPANEEAKKNFEILNKK